MPGRSRPPCAQGTRRPPATPRRSAPFISLTAAAELARAFALPWWPSPLVGDFDRRGPLWSGPRAFSCSPSRAAFVGALKPFSSPAAKPLGLVAIPGRRCDEVGGRSPPFQCRVGRGRGGIIGRSLPGPYRPCNPMITSPVQRLRHPQRAPRRPDTTGSKASHTYASARGPRPRRRSRVPRVRPRVTCWYWVNLANAQRKRRCLARGRGRRAPGAGAGAGAAAGAAGAGRQPGPHAPLCREPGRVRAARGRRHAGARGAGAAGLDAAGAAAPRRGHGRAAACAGGAAAPRARARAAGRHLPRPGPEARGRGMHEDGAGAGARQPRGAGAPVVREAPPVRLERLGSATSRRSNRRCSRNPRAPRAWRRPSAS